ncbi:MAG: C-terminal binding protein [Hyphomicrobiaceae bacterium]|nr:C-terminal binding protein [Hyphomicrobiaceae bacterium]
MTGKPKIIRTDAELECPGLDAALRGRGELVLLPDGVGEERLRDEVRDAELLLMCYTPVTARVIETTERLKGIVKYGVGIDAIDIEAAKKRKIPVVNVPAYAEETVAEGAFALMIALAKKLMPLQKAMDSHGWVWPENRWLASDLSGKTLGLVGMGRIGCSMARMAGRGFNMRVLAYSPKMNAEKVKAAGAEKREDLHTMLTECDFVSVHAVLNNETHGLIGADELAAMKPSAFLINTARGAIVDETALLSALKTGAISGAALDVYSNEPLAKDGHQLSALYDMDNVILLPHLTFFTHDAMDRLTRDTLARCDELLEGTPVLIKSLDPRLTSQMHGVTFSGSD